MNIDKEVEFDGPFRFEPLKSFAMFMKKKIASNKIVRNSIRFNRFVHIAKMKRNEKKMNNSITKVHRHHTINV